jgi:hypothetical protein
MYIAMNPVFVPALTLHAPERIHAEGELGRWTEAAHIPPDRRAPEAPNLPAGEPNQLQPSKLPLKQKNEP